MAPCETGGICDEDVSYTHLDVYKRQVLALSLLEERTATEIAVTLGRPLKTVQTQLARGRERLKKQLEGEREDDAV